MLFTHETRKPCGQDIFRIILGGARVKSIWPWLMGTLTLGKASWQHRALVSLVTPRRYSRG